MARLARVEQVARLQLQVVDPVVILAVARPRAQPKVPVGLWPPIGQRCDQVDDATVVDADRGVVLDHVHPSGLQGARGSYVGL